MLSRVFRCGLAVFATAGLVVGLLGCGDSAIPLNEGGSPPVGGINTLADNQLAARAEGYERAPDPDITDVTVETHVEFPLRDGTMGRANIYRPNKPGRYSVIMAASPYAEDYWTTHEDQNVFDESGASTRYLGFETPNPDFWIPRGYVYIRFILPGFQGAAGTPNALNLKESEAIYDAIEWAAQQSWSDGNVALFGISYYAVSQYRVATLKPPHLRCILPWEGAADPYRDVTYQGGILSQFGLLFTVGLEGFKTQPGTGDNFTSLLAQHPLYDDAWKERSVDLSKIDIPMMAVGTLVDIDLHLRGTTEAFMASPNPYKRMQLLWGGHWGLAYRKAALSEQLRFLDYWLKGIDTKIYDEPPVKVQIRTGAQSFVTRYGTDWPLPETRWTKFYLDAGQTPSVNAGSITSTAPPTQGQTVTFSAAQPEAVCALLDCPADGASFTTEPFAQDMDIAGPVSARLYVSASAGDADYIVELKDLDENGVETRFGYFFEDQPDEPVTRGWLRLSQRKLDEKQSTFFRPYHTHDEMQFVTPGEIVPIDIEIYPTAMRFKRGHRMQFSIRHNNFYRRNFKGFALYVFDPRLPNTDTVIPPEYSVSSYQSYSPPAGITVTYSGGDTPSYLLLPVVPAK